MSSLRFLIVEDDQSLGPALKEALERQKAHVDWTAKSDEAFGLCQSGKYDFIVMDCLLPGKMGVDLTVDIRKLPNHKATKVILISGIYTDQAFIQEAINTTKAMAFLKKPFNVPDLIALVEKEGVKKSLIEARKSLYQVFSKETVSTREKKKLIESMDTISGYDLPFLYSLLSQTKSSGHLNIYGQNNVLSSVTFSKGSIVGVDMEDDKTKLGAMLIESGYVSPEHVQIALNDKSPRKIGQKLIEAYQLSPHAFELVLMDQMNLRLSRSIAEAALKINFSPSEIDLTTPNIDPEKLQSYLHDWIASKLPVPWLKNLYAGWGQSKMIPTALWTANKEIFQSPILKVLPNFRDVIEKEPVLGTLMNKAEFPDVALYKGLHYLLASGLVYLQTNDGGISIAEEKDSGASIQDQQAQAEMSLQATKLLEVARTALPLGQFSKAVQALQEAAQINSAATQLHTLMAWAKIGMIDPLRKAQNLKDIEIELMQIPADEKYDATYSHVMGLYHKATGDIAQARKSFEKALALDARFMVSRREMSQLESANKPQKDLLNRDLKEVISGFFKKK